ncbi:MAG: substrate-binding domain-containing protein [Planctomycetaceae bacterium]|jgi:LacI family transcriptional regulator|nr:substrate-binding domain-containing protein [Planctomycetaceae bacterium]
MPEPPRVGLLILSSLDYGRGLLRGIASYVQTHGPWTIFHRVGLPPDRLSPLLRRWRPHGVIGQFRTRVILRQVERLGIPAVDLLGRFHSRSIPRFQIDHSAVAVMVADHFLELGYRSFAFCGFKGIHYSDRRRKAFVDYAQTKRCPVDVLLSTLPSEPLGPFDIESAGQFDVESIGTWLRSLPKPLALMAATDVRAVQVLAACRLAGLNVPEEIAVVGVGNDEVLCNLADPPLTSVALRADQLGYRGAAMLDEMMHGRKPARYESLIGPLGVISRKSTQVAAAADPKVNEVLRYLRDHFRQGVSIAAAARHAGLSSSTLRRRFSEAMKRSPREELIRIQLQCVEELLRDTDLPMGRIAELAGFRYPECMMKLFRRKTGMTPGQLRSRFRTSRIE